MVNEGLKVKKIDKNNVDEDKMRENKKNDQVTVLFPLHRH